MSSKKAAKKLKKNKNKRTKKLT
eukprot:COSAG04_NODE_25993_length_301_cov_0.509901_1_plen_22_part_01